MVLVLSPTVLGYGVLNFELSVSALRAAGIRAASPIGEEVDSGEVDAGLPKASLFSNNALVVFTTTCAAPVKNLRSRVAGTSLGWW